jgi:hypothetical protein
VVQAEAQDQAIEVTLPVFRWSAGDPTPHERVGIVLRYQLQPLAFEGQFQQTHRKGLTTRDSVNFP